MTDPTTQAALTTLIVGAISHCEREIAEMNRAVRLLERNERRRIEATYQDGQQWRGRASDDFTRMVDALVVLTEGGITFRND